MAGVQRCSGVEQYLGATLHITHEAGTFVYEICSELQCHCAVAFIKPHVTQQQCFLRIWLDAMAFAYFFQSLLNEDGRVYFGGQNDNNRWVYKRGFRGKYRQH